MDLKDIQQLPEEKKSYYALAQISAVATNGDVMAFDTAKLAASTFGRLRVRTPRVYSWRSSECSNRRLWRGCSQYMIRWWHVISRPKVLLRNELFDCNIKRRSRRPAKQRSPSRLKKSSRKSIMKCINLRRSRYLTKSSMSLEHTSGGSAAESCSHIVEVWE